MKPRQHLPRISKKRLASNGGKTPFLKRSAIRKKPRKPSEFKRIYGSKQRVEWVKTLNCAAPKCGFEQWSVEGHHIETGGTGYKADYTKIIPLCKHHHRYLHDAGRERFLKLYPGFDFEEAARTTNEAWMAFSGITEGGVKK